MPGVKFNSVNEYFDTLSPRPKKVLAALRKTIKAVVPEAEERISYNIPAFRLDGMLVWYAAWKEHVSMYPRSAAMQAAIKELANYEGAKGTIKFPLNEPLPVELVKKIVQFRMKENRQRAKEKAAAKPIKKKASGSK